MITTRLHGAVDYAVASLLGTLATSSSLPPPVRATLGTASLSHTGYSVLTDYEAGLSPRLTMRQHLALDALAGAALCGAGLLMRRQPAGARALLVAVGLSELAVVALSSAKPISGPGQGTWADRMAGRTGSPASGAGYPPLDTPKPVAPDVFIVDSLLQGLVGRIMPARMTVIRLPDGGLLLHSPTRFSLALKQKLQALGPIRHLVAPNVVHWTFLPEWQRACPDATTWAAPGLRDRSQVQESGVRLDHDLSDTLPAEWGGVIELADVPGGLGFNEVALFHRPTRTLVLTDLVLNLEPGKLPALLRPLARLFGITAPDGVPPPYLRAVVKLQRQQAAQCAARLVALQPERVIFAHGRWFEQDGTAALRRSLRWLLD
jgi:hypothetical protein